MMKIEFEYGQGTMAAELPDSTDIFIPGETVKDPEAYPERHLEVADPGESCTSNRHADLNRACTQGKYGHDHCTRPREGRRRTDQPPKAEY